MRAAIWIKTFQYRLTLVWLVGGLCIAGMGELIFALLGAEELPHYSRFASLLFFAHIAVTGPLCNYQLLAGRWSLSKWGRSVMLYFNLPATATFAWLALGMREYWIAAAFIYFSTPASFFGVFGFRRILTNFASFLLFYFALLWFQDRAFLAENGLLLGCTTFALLVLGAYMGLSSRYYGGQAEQIRALLRNTRRDRRIIGEERRRSDQLLLNILPAEIATELKDTGRAAPRAYQSITVLFTDFEGFTRIAEEMDPAELVSELDACFSHFDQICSAHKLEKLKTIGDAYMCAGGLPAENKTHVLDAALAALEIRAFMAERKASRGPERPSWELRIGLHAGPAVAGVIGASKFAYDVWGDTVNVAARLESGGQVNRINVSREVQNILAPYFACEYRGDIPVKNRGVVEMYFLEALRPEFADSSGRPNERFRAAYAERAATPA